LILLVLSYVDEMIVLRVNLKRSFINRVGEASSIIKDWSKKDDRTIGRNWG